MEEDDKKPSEKPTKGGYGKRPMWQWIVIYLVIALIVYGLIYYLFISGGNGDSGSDIGY